MRKRNLVTFLEVLETRNFNRAAERLDVMQSTVSARIRQLEDELGVRLFERGQGGARPTAMARRFEGHARAFLNVWNHARRDIFGDRNLNRQRLHLACQYSLMRNCLLEWAERLRMEGDGLNFYLEINFSAQMQRDILAGEIDIGILFAPHMQPDLHIEELAPLEFTLVSTQARKLDEVDADNYLKVAYTGYFERSHDEILPHLAFPRFILGSENIAIEQLIRRGGTVYLPRSAVKSVREKIEGLVEINDAPALSQPVYVAHHIRKQSDPAIVRALQLLKEIFPGN